MQQPLNSLHSELAPPLLVPQIRRWSERPISTYKPQNLIRKAIVLAGVRILIALDLKHRFHGPVKGSEMDPELLMRIREFRDSIYREQCPYLTSERQLKIDRELRLDERSLHFYATDREGRIVGCLRLTERPFELEALTEEWDHIGSEYRDYIEISRYVALKSARFVSERLLFVAGAWIWSKTRYRGMVSLCREKLKEHYRRYGITDEFIDGPYYVRWRQPQPYYMVVADLESIAGHIREKYL